MLLLCGKTAAGKDTIKKELIKLGMNSIVTYTTRDMREGEVDGVSYHFVTKEKFSELEYSGFFAETSSYNTANGVCYYGTACESLDEDSVIIVNPDGLKQLIKHKELNPVVVYITCDEATIWNRLRKRGDDNVEARRRINADNTDFEDVVEYADLCIKNKDISIHDLALYIYDFYGTKMFYKRFYAKEIADD